MGDVGRGFYVRPGIPALMRDRVVPAAQLITPNQFELEALTGRPTATMAELLAAADAARALGPEMVLVTSVGARRRRPGHHRDGRGGRRPGPGRWRRRCCRVRSPAPAT